MKEEVKGKERRSENRDERKNSNLYAEKRQKYIGRNRCRDTQMPIEQVERIKRTTVIRSRKWQRIIEGSSAI